MEIVQDDTKLNQKDQDRAKKRMAIALRRYLTGSAPCHKYKALFGCTQSFLKAFIAHQLNDSMTWENFGTTWQITHILPLHHFNQTKDSDLKLCWNWSNLKPVKWGEASTLNAHAVPILQERLSHFPDNINLLELTFIARKLKSTTQENWSTFNPTQGD